MTLSNKSFVELVKANLAVDPIGVRFALEENPLVSAVGIDEDGEDEFAYYELHRGLWSVATYSNEILEGEDTWAMYRHQDLWKKSTPKQDAIKILDDYTNSQLPRIQSVRAEHVIRQERELEMMLGPEGYAGLKDIDWDSVNHPEATVDWDSSGYAEVANASQYEGVSEVSASFETKSNALKDNSSPILYLLAVAGFIGLMGLVFGGVSGGGEYVPSNESNFSDSEQQSTLEVPETNINDGANSSGTFVICEDGTTSSAGGQQGACSWHGGVSP